MATDFGPILSVVQQDNWKRLAYKSVPALLETELSVFVQVPEELTALAVAYFESIDTYTNPRAGTDPAYPGTWFRVSVQPLTLQDTGARGVALTLRQGWVQTLVSGGSISFANAVLAGGDSGIKPLAEMFTVTFVNLDPSKLDDMLTELRENAPFSTPTICGNSLSGNFEIIALQGAQGEAGNGVIYMKCCKGGKNLGAVVANPLNSADWLSYISDQLKIWEGTFAYRAYVFFWLQTYAEVNALRDAINAIPATPGLSLDISGPSPRGDGGPYDMTLEFYFQLPIASTGKVKSISAFEEREELSDGQQAFPLDAVTSQAAGVIEKRTSRRGKLGLWDRIIEYIRATPRSNISRKKVVTAHGSELTEEHVHQSSALTEETNPTPGQVVITESDLDEFLLYRNKKTTKVQTAIESGKVVMLDNGIIKRTVKAYINARSITELSAGEELHGLDAHFPAPDEGGCYNYLVLGMATGSSQPQDGVLMTLFEDIKHKVSMRRKTSASIPSLPTLSDGTILKAELRERDLLFELDETVDEPKAVSVGPVEVYNDGLVKHMATFCYNQSTAPSGGDGVYILHHEFNDYNKWNYIRLAVTILTSTIGIGGSNELDQKMDMRTVMKGTYVPPHGPGQYTPGEAEFVRNGGLLVGHYDYKPGMLVLWVAERSKSKTGTRTYSLGPPGGISAPESYGDKNVGYDEQRRVWYVEHNTDSLSAWAAAPTNSNNSTNIIIS